MPYVALLESLAVTPGGEFGALRLADSHQVGAVGHARHADLVGGNPLAAVSEELLRLLDRLPALLERGQIPLGAAGADDPEAALGGVKGEATAHRKALERLVGAEVGLTRDAATEHA